MPSREELIDLAIEAYISGLDQQGLEDFVRAHLQEEYHRADATVQDNLIEATGVGEDA